MPKFVIERTAPGAGEMSAEQRREAARVSNEVIAAMSPRISWQQSYIADDKIFCVFVADDEETLLVMEGELTLIGENGETTAGPGTCVTFAPGDLHGFRNDAAASAKILVIASPGLQLAEMFRHFDRASRQGPLGPADIEAIAGQYNVRFG